jgi:hypothetical protein
MGKTHFRSDVREHGNRTASFSTFAGKAISVGSGSGNYVKLGSVYIITGSPSAFTKAGIHAAATYAAGVANAASVPRGSLFLNASSNINASQGVYVKFAPATWAVVTTGSRV